MKNKKIAFNHNLWGFLFIFLVFLALTVTGIIKQEWLMFGFSLLFLLGILFFILVEPFIIIFSKEEIQIIYTIGKKEIIPIDQIKTIFKKGSWFVKYQGLPVYVIDYPHPLKMFFMDAKLPRTKKVKKLLRIFYKKDFE